MLPARLHALTERLSSLMRSSLRQVASSHGLKLVQLEALIYLSRANRYSDMPASLTEYFGVTKGTTSQTLNALVRQGLVEKHPDPNDGRIQHCALTPEGRSIVTEAYPASCFSAVDETDLPLDALETLLRSVQRANGMKTFGQCASCDHFRPRTRGGQCGLTSETLSKADTKKICREHTLSDG